MKNLLHSKNFHWKKEKLFLKILLIFRKHKYLITIIITQLMSNNDLFSLEETKVNQILTLLQKTPQLDDLMYAREIIDLMNHFQTHFSLTSTTNLLLFLTHLHQSDPHLQEYSQVSQLNPKDQHRLNSILSRILK